MIQIEQAVLQGTSKCATLYFEGKPVLEMDITQYEHGKLWVIMGSTSWDRTYLTYCKGTKKALKEFIKGYCDRFGRNLKIEF